MWRLSQFVPYLLLLLGWLSALSAASGFHSTVGNVILSDSFLRQVLFPHVLIRPRSLHTAGTRSTSGYANSPSPWFFRYSFTFIPKPLIHLFSFPSIAAINTRTKSNLGEERVYFSLPVTAHLQRESRQGAQPGTYLERQACSIFHIAPTPIKELIHNQGSS